MSVFHQVGHDSINLVRESDLKGFSGMVCSPLNYREAQVKEQIASLPNEFSSVFDPQLYFPRSRRGHLQSWSYFPCDFDSADHTNLEWWKYLSKRVVKSGIEIKCTHACSPLAVPNKYTMSYYDFAVEIGNYFSEQSLSNGIIPYQTAIIDINIIGDTNEAEIIGSILSKTKCESIYLVVKSDIEPRREYSDVTAITGVMKMIRLLVNSGIKVFMPFCSSEFILWKYAGANAFASGKFFNLRRFTSSRFQEPTSGGGQLPYWFERQLLSYVREGDLTRLVSRNLVSSNNNPYADTILEQLRTSPKSPWLSLSWKKYLFDFYALEQELNNNKAIETLLLTAERNWIELEDDGFLMEEIRNDGAWIRQWRIAINEFNRSMSV